MSIWDVGGLRVLGARAEQHLGSIEGPIGRSTQEAEPNI